MFRKAMLLSVMCMAARLTAGTLYTVIDLGTLGGSGSTGLGINSLGQVTGSSYTASNAANHAFLYGGGVMTDLGTLAGLYSTGYGVNDVGQVTGASGDYQRAFLYSGGVMTDLGALGRDLRRGLRDQRFGPNHWEGGSEGRRHPTRVPLQWRRNDRSWDAAGWDRQRGDRHQ